MSRCPSFTSVFGKGSIPHSGIPGPPSGPAFLSTITWSAVTPLASSSTKAFISG